ncbi:MAG: beta-galactosidase, partial [Kiritimatiellaeota bacterium]|nr:beta-galactosidase [Kiritimatiellota bacterium]
MKPKFKHTAPANGFEEWNNNPEIFQLNRLEPHVDVVPYDSVKAALGGRKEDSSSYMSLNGKWKFKLVGKPAERDKTFMFDDADCSTWDDITVPGHWQTQGYDQPRYTNIKYPWEDVDKISPPFAPVNNNPVGCYKREFEIPESWDGRVVTISFQGVESAFYCWVNGEMVGYSEDSFTPAEFDITPYLKKGRNTLAVEVFRWCDGSWLEDQDFVRLSGIFRDVYLYSTPKLRVRDFTIVTDLDAQFKDATLDVKVEIDCYDCETPVGAELHFELYSADGNLLATASDNWNQTTAGSRRHNLLRVENPLKWNAEEPNLHTLVIHLDSPAGKEILRSKVGFRRFEIKDARMLINGREILFKGMNRHEWDCVKGRALNYADMLNDVRLLKQNNINAVRTSHYPNAQAFYDLCDEFGIYVMDEANIETHGTWRYGQTHEEWDNVPGSKTQWTAAVLDRANSMMQRDK